MRVILRTDVDTVGHKGDVVDVADGFARNYLLPRGWAMKASSGAEAQAEKMRRSRNVKDAADRAAAEEIAKRLVPTAISIQARVGTEGRLFGSVGTAEVVEAIAAQTGIELERRQVKLEEPIKEAGSHLIPVKLHADVEFPVTVEVSGD
ncbi:MAG: 50S ribosomal protein L9 [Acidimicrobiia bacterium]|nr:50S ribosomal protein L9 [Acidimicrobiia bacterium]